VTGGWDCHAHVFGPYSRYPLAAERSYTPPQALLADYLALLGRLGMAHGVLVHPSAYGDDRSLLIDTLASQPQLRGVMVLRAETRTPLRGLREQGVRGLRFSHRSGAGANFAGSASLQDLQSLAPAMADAGLHAELWTDAGVLPAIEQALRDLPVPVVIDHMGGFDVAAGIDAPGFRTLLRLVEGGRAWVKLCAYRNLPASSDFEAGEPFQRALQQANPGQLVWGSDWPHLRVTPAPDAAHLLAAMKRWAGDEALARRILVDNPARLYA
jgi:predicted TIM-barrel fold metal-dependent hydrolase